MYLHSHIPKVTSWERPAWPQGQRSAGLGRGRGVSVPSLQAGVRVTQRPRPLGWDFPGLGPSELLSPSWGCAAGDIHHPCCSQAWREPGSAG